MRLVAIWLVVLGLAAAIAASCSVSHRSGDFACQSSADCAGNRLCVDNFCVLAALDAGADGPQVPDDGPDLDAILDQDAAVCPAECTSCDLGALRCTIDCDANPLACTQQVACPAGWSCDVQCTPGGSCRQGVVCADGSDCSVTCTGGRSCGVVTCGSGNCDVQCIGNNACTFVTGGSVQPTTVTCSGPGSCRNIRGNGPISLTCTGANSCADVQCGEGTCQADCIGNQSCADVTCGSDACTVDCIGDTSCNQVACGASCACDVTCRGAFSCGTDLTCRPGCENGQGCISQGICNTCL